MGNSFLPWALITPTHCRVPAQQPCSLCNATIPVPTGHRTNPLYGLQTETEPLRPGDNQQIHEEGEVHYQGSQVHDPQGARRHDEVLQLKKVSGPHI